MSVESLLTQRCRIQRWSSASLTPSGLGVVTPAYADVATDVPCLVQHHGARMLRSDHGVNVTYNATGYFAIGANVRPKPEHAEHPDQVVLTSGGAGTYKTQGVLDEAGKQSHLAVALEVV